MKSCVEKMEQTLTFSRLPALAERVIEQAITIQQIPAPTFAEEARARYLADRFRMLGLQQVEQDTLSNVFGLLPGVNRQLPAIMISAHTDTVFKQSTDLTVRREAGLIYGPGLGDNSVGVAGMLGLIEALSEDNRTPQRDLWFVATSREEGLGNLGGARAAYERLKNRIDSVINIEGLALGHIYHAGISVRRLHITVSADGGHSWLHFGRPSAVHGLVQLSARILDIKPPQSPRTTYNIGMIEGGQAINAIGTGAELWLDMRSEDRASLEQLEKQVRAHVNALHTDELRFEVEVVGDRPAGRISTNHPLVEGALTALAQIDIRGTLETGSTDANVPLAAGCPAVTVGITRGGNAHRLDEYIETAPVKDGLHQLILLVLAAAETGGFEE